MNFSDRRQLLQAVARLYYIENVSQSEIADQFFMSKSSVSRLINEACKTGCVQFVISGFPNTNSFLQKELIRRFSLKDALVLSPVSELSKEIGDEVASLTACYLDSILRPDSVIGITRGRMIRSMIESLCPLRELPVHVVQLFGLINTSHNDDGELELVRNFAKAYNGSYHHLFAPFLAKDRQNKELISALPAVASALQYADQASIVVSPLSRADFDSPNSLWKQYLSGEVIRRLQEKEAVGLFCGHYYDKQGRFIQSELLDLMISIDIRHIIQKEYVIGFAAGPEKTPAILGALNGSLINVLITDEKTALKLLIDGSRPESAKVESGF